jgi:hypothetical protein
MVLLEVEIYYTRRQSDIWMGCPSYLSANYPLTVYQRFGNMLPPEGDKLLRKAGLEDTHVVFRTSSTVERAKAMSIQKISHCNKGLR